MMEDNPILSRIEVTCYTWCSNGRELILGTRKGYTIFAVTISSSCETISETATLHVRLQREVPGGVALVSGSLFTPNLLVASYANPSLLLLISRGDDGGQLSDASSSPDASPFGFYSNRQAERDGLGMFRSAREFPGPIFYVSHNALFCLVAHAAYPNISQDTLVELKVLDSNMELLSKISLPFFGFQDSLLLSHRFATSFTADDRWCAFVPHQDQHKFWILSNDYVIKPDKFFRPSSYYKVEMKWRSNSIGVRAAAFSSSSEYLVTLDASGKRIRLCQMLPFKEVQSIFGNFCCDEQCTAVLSVTHRTEVHHTQCPCCIVIITCVTSGGVAHVIKVHDKTGITLEKNHFSFYPPRGISIKIPASNFFSSLNPYKYGEKMLFLLTLEVPENPQLEEKSFQVAHWYYASIGLFRIDLTTLAFHRETNVLFPFCRSFLKLSGFS